MTYAVIIMLLIELVHCAVTYVLVREIRDQQDLLRRVSDMAQKAAAVSAEDSLRIDSLVSDAERIRNHIDAHEAVNKKQFEEIKKWSIAVEKDRQDFRSFKTILDRKRAERDANTSTVH